MLRSQMGIQWILGVFAFPHHHPHKIKAHTYPWVVCITSVVASIQRNTWVLHLIRSNSENIPRRTVCARKSVVVVGYVPTWDFWLHPCSLKMTAKPQVRLVYCMPDLCALWNISATHRCPVTDKPNWKILQDRKFESHSITCMSIHIWF